MDVSAKIARSAVSASALVIALAVASPATAQYAANPATASGSAESEQEIVVTARKREQRLLDIASGIAVQTGEELEARRAQNMEDLFRGEPGVTFQKTSPDQSFPVIRGISTGSSLNLVTVPVGVYLGDVPVSDPQNPQSVLDVNPIDLERVEILKGPQGSLYGANSLAGAVRYIFRRPELGESASGYTDISAFDVANGGIGYRAATVLNIASQTAGVRLVGWSSRAPGYIDNISAGEEGANDYSSHGVRITGMVQPSDDFTATLVGMAQWSKVSDYFLVDDPANLSFTGNPTKSSHNFRAYFANLVLEYEFSDNLSLTSNTALIDKRREVDLDITNSGLFCVNFLAFFGIPMSVPHCKSTVPTDGSQFFQELRLAGSLGERLNFLVGASFQTAKTHVGGSAGSNTFNAPGFTSQIAPFLPPGITPTDLGPLDAYLYSESLLKNKETAIFSELQFDVTPSLQLTAGGRYFKNTSELPVQYFNGYYTLLFFNPGSLEYSNPFNKSSEDGFVPKFSALFKIDNRQSIYATAAQGYRFGGVNVIPETGQTTQGRYQTDKLWNYEIGYRGSPANGFTLDAAAYLMKWSDAQIQVTGSDNFQRVRNAGQAEVKGVEIGARLDISPAFTVRAAGAYTDAKLTEPLTLSALLTLPKGSPLPGTPKFAGSISGDLRFSGPFGSEGNAALTYSRTGRSWSDIEKTQRIGGADLLDFRLGFKRGQVEVSIFANNLTDERSKLGVSVFPSVRYSITQPRTIGLGMRFDY